MLEALKVTLHLKVSLPLAGSQPFPRPHTAPTAAQGHPRPWLPLPYSFFPLCYHHKLPTCLSQCSAPPAQAR